MRDAFDHDHFVGTILKKNILWLECNNFLVLLFTELYVTNSLQFIKHFILHDFERKSLWLMRGLNYANFLNSVIPSDLAHIILCAQVILVAALTIDFNSRYVN